MIRIIDNSNYTAGARLYRTAARRWYLRLHNGSLSAGRLAPALAAGRRVPNAVFLTITSSLKGNASSQLCDRSKFKVWQQFSIVIPSAWDVPFVARRLLLLWRKRHRTRHICWHWSSVFVDVGRSVCFRTASIRAWSRTICAQIVTRSWGVTSRRKKKLFPFQ